MDSITQAALGATIGEVTLGRKIGNKGALLGAIIATIPDLDVFMVPLYSTFQRISIHRGYSHSILFSVIGAMVLMYILSRVKWTRDISKVRLLITSWLLLFTHMLLDAFTPYGTQLFLPVSNYRVSFDSINVVDPFYTVPLLIGLICSIYLFRKHRSRLKFAGAGLIISSAYLLLTVGIKEYVSGGVVAALNKAGYEYHSVMTVPVGLGSTDWYGIGTSDSSLYMAKIDDLQMDNLIFTEFAVNDYLLKGLDPLLIEKMKWFAKGNYIVANYEGKIAFYNLQVDMQGIRNIGDYKAPTAFYYEITPHSDGTYDLISKQHIN